MVQNLISVVILLVLELFHVISTEKLTWKLIKVWIPVNLIFVGMLVTGMYRCVLPHPFIHDDQLITLTESNSRVRLTTFPLSLNSCCSCLNSEVNIIGTVGLLTLQHFKIFFQFKVHKCRDGDDIEEHDKYFNSYRGDIYFQEGSE